MVRFSTRAENLFKKETYITIEVVTKEDFEFLVERLDKFTERYDRNLKAEAIKEFAERLGNYKEYRYNENCDFVPYVRMSDIRKVEKEMIGADNDK